MIRRLRIAIIVVAAIVVFILIGVVMCTIY